MLKAPHYFMIVTLLAIVALAWYQFRQPSYAHPIIEEKILETPHFEFYHSFWLNLHHYLYQQAKRDQFRYLDTSADEAILAQLSEEEKRIRQKAVDFYAARLIDKHLLFNDSLSQLKRQLISFQENEALDSTSFGIEYERVANNFAGIYSAYFWPVHATISKQKLDSNSVNIKKFEASIFERMEALAHREWPDEKLRIDLSVYTSGNSAYTSNRQMHSVISTADQRSLGYHWTETIFHEASHVLFSPSAPVAKEMNRVADSLEVELPRAQWHAVDFYIVGLLMEEQFASIGIDYSMYMVANNVFGRRLTASFKNSLDQYVNGQEPLNNTMEALVLGLK